MTHREKQAFRRTIRRVSRIAVESGRKDTARIIRIFERARETAERAGLSSQVEFLNLILFATLYASDLSILTYEMGRARTPEHKRLYARVLALTTVEGFEDFAYLLGKPTRNLCRQFSVEVEVSNQLKEVHRKLGELRRRYEFVFRSVRNHSIAHREHDARTQLKWASALKPRDLERISADLLIWTALLLKFLADLQTYAFPSLGEAARLTSD